jgi:hypothetical protein
MLQSSIRARLAQSLLWSLNLVAVFLVTHYLFRMNSRGLFGLGWDQQAYQAFHGNWHRLAGVVLGVGMDPVNGMGNIAFPYNPAWFPSYWLAAGASGFIDNWPLSYAVAASALFAATAACGRIHGFSLGLSLAAAWLLTLTTWPIYAPPKIIALWLYVPQPGEVVCVAVLTASAAFRLGQDGLRHALWLSLAVFLGISFFVLARPTFLVLAVPGIAVGALAGLLSAPDRRARLWIVSCWAGIGAACLAFGYVHYVAGLFSYTAAGQFPDLGKRLPTLYSGEATLLLWSPIHSWRGFFEEPVRVFVAGGLAGSLAMALFGSARQRQLGAGIFALEAVLITIGLSNFKYNYWFGPAIWYFEEFLFPFFALGCAFLLALPFILLWRAAVRWGGVDTYMKFSPAALANLALAVVLPLSSGVHAAKVGKRVKAASESYVGYDMGSGWPQPASPITQRLKEEIRIVPGQPFRGRVVTMLGRMFPKEPYWGRYSLVHYFAQLGTGNLHDGPGLWQDDIPTVLEYSALMTPAYLAFVRTFLTEPDDIIFRNLMGTRRMNEPILRMMGVRFVLTDRPLAGLALRERIDVPVSAATRKRLEFEKETFSTLHLYLYELPQVNLGQFSPVEVRIARDANHALTLLSDPALNPAHTAVVSEPIDRRLAPGSLQSFVVGRDDYRIRATSEGVSLLLLPVEFSRCLRLESPRQGARLLRVNLMFTGVLFERQLDAEISFRSGPFGASRCRLEDLDDSRAMRMPEAFRDRPDYGRLGWQDYWTRKRD